VVRFVPIYASVAYLESLRHYYEEQLDVRVEVLPALTPDPSAWTSERGQWSAEGLAEQVWQAVGAVDAVTIGITGDDLYRRNVDWQNEGRLPEGEEAAPTYVFGWRADEYVAVVSYARMDPRVYGDAADAKVLQQRLKRMITKELGLMLAEPLNSLDRAER
jgi:predicted Zn-dependent protease